MANLTLVQAVNDGLRTALKSDPSVVVFGEDVGPKGGVFTATQGLTSEFGETRCFDTPLSEDGIVGTAIGKISIGQSMRTIWPFWLAGLFVLLVVAFVPALSLWLPAALKS